MRCNGGCKRDTARICCWAPGRAAINRYILAISSLYRYILAEPTAANPLHARTDRRTGGRTSYRYRDPAARYASGVNKQSEKLGAYSSIYRTWLSDGGEMSGLY